MGWILKRSPSLLLTDRCSNIPHCEKTEQTVAGPHTGSEQLHLRSRVGHQPPKKKKTLGTLTDLLTDYIPDVQNNLRCCQHQTHAALVRRVSWRLLPSWGNKRRWWTTDAWLPWSCIRRDRRSVFRKVNAFKTEAKYPLPTTIQCRIYLQLSVKYRLLTDEVTQDAPLLRPRWLQLQLVRAAWKKAQRKNKTEVYRCAEAGDEGSWSEWGGCRGQR